jgi:sporulation protein YlmC with PRC-barrel domain
MDMERIAILEVDVRVAATGMRATHLIGADVYNDRDEHIGTLDDLMIGDDGTVGFAILSVGGFLGLGSHLVAVTFDSLTIDNYRVVLPGATRDELRRLPEFHYS